MTPVPANVLTVDKHMAQEKHGLLNSPGSERVEISTMVHAEKDWAILSPSAIMHDCGFIMVHGRELRAYRRFLIVLCHSRNAMIRVGDS